MSALLDPARHYVIGARDKEDGLLFWSNGDGFGGLDAATVFTGIEAREAALPLADEPPDWFALPSSRTENGSGRSNPHVQSRIRLDLLDHIHSLLWEYLIDECPDDENWEDFDPEIDALSSTIEDARQREAEQVAGLPKKPLRFMVDVEFASSDQPFATETYEVEAFNWTAAKCAAFRLADDSPYSNERIPALNRRAVDRNALGLTAPG